MTPLAFIIGGVAGMLVTSWFASRTYDRGAADARAEMARGEEARRTDSYDKGYTTGFQAGRAGARPPMHTTIIVDPETFHRYRDLLAANRQDATVGE